MSLKRRRDKSKSSSLNQECLAVVRYGGKEFSTIDQIREFVWTIDIEQRYGVQSALLGQLVDGTERELCLFAREFSKVKIPKPEQKLDEKVSLKVS
jgi:hypothetical protein